MLKKHLKFFLPALLILVLVISASAELSAESDLDYYPRIMFYNSRDMILTLSLNFTLGENPAPENRYIFYIPQITTHDEHQTVLNKDENKMYAFAMNNNTGSHIIRIQLKEVLPPGFKFIIPPPEPVIKENPLYIKADPPEGLWEEGKAVADLSVFTYPIGEDVTWEAAWCSGTETPGPEANWINDSPVFMEQVKRGIWYLHVKAQHTDKAVVKKYFGPFQVGTDYSLTVNSTAGGGVTEPGEGEFSYGCSEAVTLRAEAAEGYEFTHWTVSGGHEAGFANHEAPVTIFTMPADDVTVTAHFDVKQYTLTYTAGSNGSIEGVSPQTVAHGEDGLEVKAVPDAGFHFAGWCDGMHTAIRTDENVTGDLSVTAVFAETTIAFNPDGGDWNRSHLTEVTVNAGSLTTANEYQWTTTPDFPGEGLWNVFDSGSVIEAPEDETGVYYLHVKAVDTENPGNVATAVSSPFYQDNVMPEITFDPYGDLENWRFRSDITIDASKIGYDLTGFPVLVRLDEEVFDFTKAMDNGHDIRFTSHNGMLLDYERERHDAGAGVAEYWVKIPFISSVDDTVFYMYFGNSGAEDGENAAAVWDNDFVSVWHKNDGNSNFMSDSTENGYHGSKKGANEPALIDGMIAGGQYYDGNDYVLVDKSASVRGLSEVSISAWIKPDGWLGVNNRWYHESNGVDGMYSRISLSVNTDGTPHLGFREKDSNSFTSYDGNNTVNPPGEWTFITYVIDMPGNEIRIYIDAELDSVFSRTMDSFSDTEPVLLEMGRYIPQNLFYRGIVDEIRLSSAVRCAAWIEAEFLAGTGVLLNIGPAQNTYRQEHTTTVFVFDEHSGINNCWYRWSDAAAAPEWNEEMWTAFSGEDIITTPGGVTGSRYLHIRATDNAGNPAVAVSGAFNLDNTPPQIQFDPEGNENNSQSHSTTVTVNDVFSGVDETTMEYRWTSSPAFPEEDGSWTSFTAEENVITTPEGQSGSLYLHVRASDNCGNEARESSEAFNVVPPVPQMQILNNIFSENRNHNPVVRRAINLLRRFAFF